MRSTTVLAVAAALTWSTAAPAAEPLRLALDAEATKLALAQTAADRDSGWLRVQQLTAGQDLVVLLRDGTAVPGKSVRADASSIRLNNPGSSRLIPRQDIYRIDMARGPGSALGAAVGAAGGALVGLSFVSRVDWYECSCGMGPATVAVIPIGAAIGLGIVGYRAFRHEPETIYIAP
jgi:hypothetical protein